MYKTDFVRLKSGRNTFASTTLNSETCSGNHSLVQARSWQLHLHALSSYLPDLHMRARAVYSCVSFFFFFFIPPWTCLPLSSCK